MRKPYKRKSVEERFMNKVEFDTNNGCWLWTGSLSHNGYGEFQLNGKPRRATHISLELFKGQTKPEGMVVSHSCNVPACVNPEHIAYDTQANNLKYMVECNRQVKGTKQHSAKLDDDKIRDIRLKLANGKTPTELAKEYGVWQRTMQKINERITWKHVE